LGQEDCLTLNVYAPGKTSDALLPVMVWIHGGGNYAGTAGEYDGATLAVRENVVVVTINYRLGPFGWFHHPAMRQGEGGEPATGQFALLDMIEALKWVQSNIEGFHGDPTNVTIFGESAGAQNVYALVLAESANGLFQKAIAQSGGFWNMGLDQATNYRDEMPPGTRASAKEIVASLLVEAGRATDSADARQIAEGMSNEETLAWMRELTTVEILQPYQDQPDLGYDLPSVVLDGVMLPTQDHRQQIRSGAYNNVPMIIGGNRNEQKAWQAFDPDFVQWDGDYATVIDPDRYTAMDKHYSDWWNVDAVDDLADRLTAPVFAYRFDWDDAPKQPADLSFIVGAAHGLEVPFVFGTFNVTGYAELFTQENRLGREVLSDAMMSYWAAFAYSGDPGRGTGDQLPEWLTWQRSHEKMIFDSGTLEMHPGLLTRSEVLESIQADTSLSLADRCKVLRYSLMYPSFDLARLRAIGCAAHLD
jgi:para-nitrobenzyl esterase